MCLVEISDSKLSFKAMKDWHSMLFTSVRWTVLFCSGSEKNHLSKCSGESRILPHSRSLDGPKIVSLTVPPRGEQHFCTHTKKPS